jgi:hypothetical protein
MDLKYRILDHLVQTPDASDTAQGIAEWWLVEQRIRSAVHDVRQALEDLAREGWIRKLERADGGVHYRVQEDRLGEIRKLLSLGPSQSGISQQ